jgi:hypothetical protein
MSEFHSIQILGSRFRFKTQPLSFVSFSLSTSTHDTQRPGINRVLYPCGISSGCSGYKNSEGSKFLHPIGLLRIEAIFEPSFTPSIKASTCNPCKAEEMCTNYLIVIRSSKFEIALKTPKPYTSNPREGLGRQMKSEQLK